MRRAQWLVLGAGVIPFAARAEGNSTSLPPPSAELLAPRPHSAGQPSMHPPVVLRDGNGAPVLTSGEPVSAAKTCDGCHDVAWIEAHDYHRDPVGEAFHSEPARVAGGNCFLCHVRAADNDARVKAIASGRLDEVATATLVGTGLVVNQENQDGRWLWQKDQFRPDGTLAAATLGLSRPANRACGFCHGVVYDDPAPLLLGRNSQPSMTELEGSVWSGQRMSDSAMNLANKDRLTRPWDVHAERMVSCASCHVSPNHPAYSFSERGPDHLQFDARRVAITEYLRRPDHRFARGPGGSGASHREGNIRRCENCHDAGKVHGFLPRAARHFAALLCESCHVPTAYAGAREVTDWTMLTATREPRVVYRGVGDDGFLAGFRPLLLPRELGDGTRKLGPNNLVTTFQWVESANGKNRPISREVLERAFFVTGGYRPELVRALDRNGDGKLQADELVLNSEAKVRVARDLLLASGASAPTITGEVRAHELHHGVSPGRFATRDCATCHVADSRIDAPFVVAGVLPFGVTPAFAAAPGTLVRDQAGQLLFQPQVAGLHVFGHTRSRALDVLGMMIFAGAIAGAGGHALLRIRAARRRDHFKKEQP